MRNDNLNRSSSKQHANKVIPTPWSTLGLPMLIIITRPLLRLDLLARITITACIRARITLHLAVPLAEEQVKEVRERKV